MILGDFFYFYQRIFLFLFFYWSLKNYIFSWQCWLNNYNIKYNVVLRGVYIILIYLIKNYEYNIKGLNLFFLFFLISICWFIEMSWFFSLFIIFGHNLLITICICIFFNNFKVNKYCIHFSKIHKKKSKHLYKNK